MKQVSENAKITKQIRFIFVANCQTRSGFAREDFANFRKAAIFYNMSRTGKKAAR